MGNYPIRAAFVSTNSICQGEQVANVWKPIYDLGVRIDFAHDTFRWRNEATEQAHVYVVIVGFSKLSGKRHCSTTLILMPLRKFQTPPISMLTLQLRLMYRVEPK